MKGGAATSFSYIVHAVDWRLVGHLPAAVDLPACAKAACPLSTGTEPRKQLIRRAEGGGQVT